MHLHHAQKWLAILFILLERANRFGQLNARQVCRSVKDCRNGAAHAARLVGVVRDATGHQQAAQVRVTQTERTE